MPSGASKAPHEIATRFRGDPAGPRIYAPVALRTGACVDLPEAAARHVQVLRLQPGHGLTLFDGNGGEFEAQVERMGRSDVTVRVGEHHAIEREAPREVHLAIGMPANDRMDWLVEKATELGAASIQPLSVARSVLKLTGERAVKKQQHWQGIAIAACEQCGRNRVPVVHAVRGLKEWLALGVAGERWLLSPAAGVGSWGVTPAYQTSPGDTPVGWGNTPAVFLSGPEGGLTTDEEQLAQAAGFRPASLGPRILRAETAPLAALALLTLFP
ncbi:MAG: 16S rRNA (uracil(1498)-N(3))-methyltransferase [Burkholderiales bacterium]|nr:16S rRNA (uracil(1498)-N(3))-methyltransferase [Burkholderiales bacterium]